MKTECKPVTIPIEADTSELHQNLDLLIEKAEKLKTLLTEVSELIRNFRG